MPRTIEIGRTGAVLTGITGTATTAFVALTEAGSPTAPNASRAFDVDLASFAPSPSSVAQTTVSPARPKTTIEALGLDLASFAPSPSSAPAMTRSLARPKTTIEAHALDRRDAATAVWHTELDGNGGPIVMAGRQIAVSLGGTAAAGLELRGEPGAVVAALDATTGAVAWKVAIDATEWCVIAAVAAAAGDVVVGGSFSGTLRAGAQVVSSGGKSDGFVARITAAGQVAWLIRVGGPGADAVQGVATAGERIAIAGTFAAGADLRGLPLSPFDERLLAADGFVAELDAAGAARWAQSFGGPADEAVAGVAIDATGRIAVAASVRDTVHAGGADLEVSGPADGLVAWWTPGGGAGHAMLIGGSDFDGLRAIAPAGEHVVVGGFFSGTLRLGAQSLVAAGGDDAFLAELAADGSVVSTWPISGEGREEIAALAAVPGGFIAGVSHTAAATVGPDALAAPTDPLSGAAIVVRPVR